jgi:hypothetical protein
MTNTFGQREENFPVFELGYSDRMTGGPKFVRSRQGMLFLRLTSVGAFSWINLRIISSRIPLKLKYRCRYKQPGAEIDATAEASEGQHQSPRSHETSCDPHPLPRGGYIRGYPRPGVPSSGSPPRHAFAHYRTDRPEVPFPREVDLSRGTIPGLARPPPRFGAPGSAGREREYRARSPRTFRPNFQNAIPQKKRSWEPQSPSQGSPSDIAPHPLCAHVGHSAALARFSKPDINSARVFDRHGRLAGLQVLLRERPEYAAWGGDAFYVVICRTER